MSSGSLNTDIYSSPEDHLIHIHYLILLYDSLQASATHLMVVSMEAIAMYLEYAAVQSSGLDYDVKRVRSHSNQWRQLISLRTLLLSGVCP